MIDDCLDFTANQAEFGKTLGTDLAAGVLTLPLIRLLATRPDLKTKIVSFTGCSNILGTFTDLQKIIGKAKSVGAVTVLDAAQLISQRVIDVQSLDVDFLVFSAHKLFGPFGFGILYGKKALLEKNLIVLFGQRENRLSASIPIISILPIPEFPN